MDTAAMVGMEDMVDMDMVVIPMHRTTVDHHITTAVAVDTTAVDMAVMAVVTINV